MLYGHTTGLSPIAVVLSATFWTSLWGPIGLVLATPLTICLVVLGRHVERLQFLDVMFGDRPALSPPEIFYQRMLAGDPTEALDKAEEFLRAPAVNLLRRRRSQGAEACSGRRRTRIARRGRYGEDQGGHQGARGRPRRSGRQHRAQR
jgi:hypothetical protein